MKNLPKNTDSLEKLSHHARHILRASFDIAQKNGSKNVEPRHLLAAILLEEHSLGNTLLRQFGINEEQIQNSTTSTKTRSNIVPTLSKETQNIIANAFLLAHRFSYPYVGSEHFVHALINSKENNLHSLFPDDIVVASKKDTSIPFARFTLPGLPRFPRLLELPSFEFPHEETGDSIETATPFLDEFGIPLGTGLSHSLPASRSREIESILRTLGRKTKSNPLLIGEPGVGKTTLVETVAHLLTAKKTKSPLDEKRIILLDLAAIVAGTSFRGEFESRLKEIVRETRENPNIILFLDEIHTLVGAGNVSGGLDAANILKPALSRGDIRCIGATTLTEYKRHIEKDPALERRFHVIRITEPTPDESVRILTESRKSYEDHHDILISDEAIRASVSLSIRYLPGRFLPDKAFDILDEAASLLRRRNQTEGTETEEKTYHSLLHAQKKIATLKNQSIKEQKFEEAARLRAEEHQLHEERLRLETARREKQKKHPLKLSESIVTEAVALLSDTPLEKISGQNESRYTTLFPTLSTTVIGQREALETLAKAVIRSHLNLGKTPHRPRGSFLFLGPSGVGKTLTATALSEALFEGKKSFIRFDMSEFRERHHMAQMIGSPAGYVGYGEGGTLTEHIRRRPASIVLFDEIEKAHPDILNLLLQILEEGVLTDAEGKRAHFGESFILLTSNIGSASFHSKPPIGFKSEAFPISFENQREQILEKLAREIKPELLARLDHTIVFRPLDQNALAEIAQKELIRLKTDLQKHSIAFSFSKEIPEYLAQKSSAEHSGARALHKVMREQIEDPIAERLISLKNFPSRIHLSVSAKKTIIIRL